MISTIQKRLVAIPKWIYWLLLILTGLVLVVTEDYFVETDMYAVTILSYTLLVMFLISYWFFKQVRLVLSLRNERTKTELMHLQSQVNPHFFFNTLNNLYGWVERDPKKAQELILHLSDMMRYSIYDGQKKLVTLEEEVDYLKNYIELHRMRYLKEIAISFNIDLEEENTKVTPLLFIILLENAFKHGVENLREGAYVTIDISSKAGAIYFSIENNFDPTENKGPTGIGLKNLRRRLELIYPKKHELSLTTQDSVYQAQLTIHHP